MREMIRRVVCQPLTGSKIEIRMYDTGRRDSRGMTRIEVEADRLDLNSGERKVLFSGSDLYMSPGMGTCDDSDAMVKCAVSMVAMRPGDTDSDWFDNYSPDQLEWSRSYECEALQESALDLSETELDGWRQWTDLDDNGQPIDFETGDPL